MRTGRFVHDEQGHVIVDMSCNVCEATIVGTGRGACGTWITIKGDCRACRVTTTGRQHLDCKHGRS